MKALFLTIFTVSLLSPIGDASMKIEPEDDAAIADANGLEGRNRLGEETSPYLLQHALNPVHWYPWGEEAFEAARAQNKPIFMSIGYSTCYWCHVMERESFEDQEVADILNEHFIAVKVDREERPDIDDIYMTATQLINRGRGGWPMSVWLEPNSLKPFYAGTYYPKDDRGMQRGFMSLLNSINEKWETDHAKVITQADHVANIVANQLTLKQQPTPLDSSVVESGVSALLARYDKDDGGYSAAPKFPMPVFIDFLMEAGWDIPQVRKSITHTLDEMYMGGMYDQVGGGFHRYSTDGKWLIPHFEKMLYDNGQLASTYARAYELTGDDEYARVVHETLQYVNRCLRDERGGFYSAQDAESNHLEGETYLWREAEIDEALAAHSEEERAFVKSVYGVDGGTNFQDPHHPEVPATNVLYLTDTPNRLASANDLSIEAFHDKLNGLNEALMLVRDERDQPGTDDKVIAAWNGLMISGFADAGRILGNQQWIIEAERAAEFIQDHLMSGDELHRTWRDGKKGGTGFLIDYAAMVRGMIAIYKANHNRKALDYAIALYNKAKALFFVEGEGWYDTEADQSDLFVRTRSLHDGAIPAATSMMLENEIQFAELTRESHWINDALATLDSESQLMKESPLAVVFATKELDGLLKNHPEKFDEPFEVSMANPSPVRMSVEPELLSIPAGSSGEIVIKLRFATNWHINSNAPKNEYAVPISFQVLTEGVTVSPQWPIGKDMISAGESVNVFGEVVEIPITINTSASAKGGVRLMVTWQACNEDTCLEPNATRVPCEITVE